MCMQLTRIATQEQHSSYQMYQVVDIHKHNFYGIKVNNRTKYFALFSLHGLLYQIAEYTGMRRL